MDATTRTLYWFCGAINGLFLFFHVLLFLLIRRISGLDPEIRALLTAFNLGGALMIGYLTFAFLAAPRDLATRLGRFTIVLGVLVYLTRALAEVFLFPHPSLAVLAACLVTSSLHLGAWKRTEG